MKTRLTTFFRNQTQRWLRIGSVLISFAAITLLASAFGAHLYSASLSSVLLTLSLIALWIAIGLHVRFLLLARREHRETVSVLDATEQEYKSVFDSTLTCASPWRSICVTQLVGYAASAQPRRVSDCVASTL